jgi:hypothetical protein
MTTTELIKLLSRVEHGASGRPREISFRLKNCKKVNVFEPTIEIDSTGDGCAGAELTLRITDVYDTQIN